MGVGYHRLDLLSKDNSSLSSEATTGRTTLNGPGSKNTNRVKLISKYL